MAFIYMGINRNYLYAYFSFIYFELLKKKLKFVLHHYLCYNFSSDRRELLLLLNTGAVYVLHMSNATHHPPVLLLSSQI
jgi:hypothetical protein